MVQLSERGIEVATVKTVEAPFLPWQYCWSPCGTRLAIASNWSLDRYVTLLRKHAQSICQQNASAGQKHAVTLGSVA